MEKQILDKVKKAVAILLAIFFVATLTATSVIAVQTVDVTIKDYAFAPNSVQISTGDTVRWTVKDVVDYRVTTVSGPSTFDSGIIHPGQSYSYKFTNPGTYEYKNSIQSTMIMKGTVKVV